MIVLAGFNSLVSKDGIVTYISGNAEIGNGCKGRCVDGVVDFCEVKSDPAPMCVLMPSSYFSGAAMMRVDDCSPGI